jgi:biopolymer transport protein ExbD
MAIKAESDAQDADMVPFIDIVTLLLLFLIVVGDMASKVNSVAMKLPRADQAQSEKALKIKVEGRIVVQLYKDAQNKYCAVIENKRYELVGKTESNSLITYLEDLVTNRVRKGLATKAETGETSFPVKLRLPADSPMSQVERVMMACAKAGLVHVHYAAEPDFSAGKKK